VFLQVLLRSKQFGNNFFTTEAQRKKGYKKGIGVVDEIYEGTRRRQGLWRAGIGTKLWSRLPSFVCYGRLRRTGRRQNSNFFRHGLTRIFLKHLIYKVLWGKNSYQLSEFF
jgi:hypothetical protein